MAKKESLPAHLQEKNSRGDDHLTLYERYEKPITCRSRLSLSNPRSTNDIVRAFSRANLTLLQSATNRVLTVYFLINFVWFLFLFFFLRKKFWVNFLCCFFNFFTEVSIYTQFFQAKNTFQSLHFQAIPILVPTFYFYRFQSLS